MVTKGLILKKKKSSLFIFIIIIVCIIDHQTASDTSPTFNIYMYQAFIVHVAYVAYIVSSILHPLYSEPNFQWIPVHCVLHRADD